MVLTNSQIEFYHREGYLIIENLLQEEDIALLRRHIDHFAEYTHLPSVICDDNNEIRSIFAPHQVDSVFSDFYQWARFVVPSQQLIDDQVYLYQYKLNLKKAFAGISWEWHQDFAYWQLDDGVERPDMTSLMIYLNDTRAYQGPLLIIPRSHLFDVVEFKKKKLLQINPAGRKVDLIHSIGSDLKYTVNEQVLKSLADQNGIKVLEYKAGTGIFFHPNLFHASNGNISPYNRDTAILTYNSIHNLPKNTERPPYIVNQDYQAIAPIPKEKEATESIKA